VASADSPTRLREARARGKEGRAHNGFLHISGEIEMSFAGGNVATEITFLQPFIHSGAVTLSYYF
jgi:hypothetical protein